MSSLNNQSTRAGVYKGQGDGFRAFIPKPLPPKPKVAVDYEMANLLSKANRALGRLDGSAEILPNPDLFVAGYVRKEAILSSQIEGTQASLEDVLTYEAVSDRRRKSIEIGDVVNYVRAMNHGLSLLGELPVGVKLLLELHAELLKGVRGEDKRPGEFRQVQNWIGPAGCNIFDATFVPPPASEVEKGMIALEEYIRSDKSTPTLMKCALAHAQFETIHPFLDGNGRLGRLLVILILCQERVLTRPILYLSAYYKQHRAEYYYWLQNIRDMGDWEGWIKFFLRGVWLVSDEAFDTARDIIAMRETHRQQILRHTRSPAKGLVLLDYLFENPMINIREVAELLGFSYPAASKLVDALFFQGLLEETSGRQRNRLFSYRPYLELLRKGTEPMRFVEE